MVSGLALYECIEHTRSPVAPTPLPPDTVRVLTVSVGPMSNAPWWSKYAARPPPESSWIPCVCVCVLFSLSLSLSLSL